MTPAEFPGLWHDGMNISRMGVVTNIHLCDLGIEGACTLHARALLLWPSALAQAADAARLHRAALQARWSQ